MNLNYLQPAMSVIADGWLPPLHQSLPLLATIDHKLQELVANGEVIYPPPASIFRALTLAPEQVRVVIIGQDPYHGAGEANGLAFAVNSGTKLPPSLRNIFKEIAQEYPEILLHQPDYTLESWQQQGVLLLNAGLTVIKDQANSLVNLGWHQFTDTLISHLNQINSGCVFMLWGNYARSKKNLIDNPRHLILEAVHPSPLSASRGFFGCNHFRQANDFLIKNHLSPINWIG